MEETNTTHIVHTSNNSSANTAAGVGSNIEPALPLVSSTTSTTTAMNYDTTVEPHFDGRMVENSDKGTNYDPLTPPSMVPVTLSENAVQGTRTHRYIGLLTKIKSSMLYTLYIVWYALHCSSV